MAEEIELIIEDVEQGPLTEEGSEPVTLHTNRGTIHGRYYPAADARRAVVMTGGAGGGFDTPVRGSLYPWLCQELPKEGIACLRVAYRHSTDLLEATLDVLAGLAFLQDQGIESAGLVGWSFGGAVVIQAASASSIVGTVVTIATQSAGVERVSKLGPACSILLVHGKQDSVLPPRCSQMTYDRAREPKRLLLHDTGNHGLDEWSDELPGIVRDWLREQLK